MKKIDVAKLGRSVGLNGELKIYILTDFPEQFTDGATFYVSDDKLSIESYNANANTVKFKGINDVSSAKRLTNRVLSVSIEETRKHCILKKDEFFWFDIIGLDIIEDNTKLGRVKNILEYPPTHYLEISTDKHLLDKNVPKLFLFPYVKDRYIINVDLENNLINTKDVKELMLTQ
jgi:16S rRNA processing protein RimM